jgi:hypothetical protein
MMRDQNLVRLSGTIFWSKLDDRQTYTVLRLGVKLGNGGSVFVTVNNPNTKSYELIKAGNKIVVANSCLDTWEKEGGEKETQIKANDSGVQFFSKEKSLADINTVLVLGKVLSYEGDTAYIEMYGDRNPKTDKPSIRKAQIKIGDSFKDIVGSKLFAEAEIVAIDVEGKSKLVVAADYDKIIIY